MRLPTCGLEGLVVVPRDAPHGTFCGQSPVMCSPAGKAASDEPAGYPEAVRRFVWITLRAAALHAAALFSASRSRYGGNLSTERSPRMRGTANAGYARAGAALEPTPGRLCRPDGR